MDADSDLRWWLVWRLVSPQDYGQYPKDGYDQFDLRNGDGKT
jgi:hypothetical protein